MLGRYQIVRGKRSPDDPLPEGSRQDTRKHTRHVLRPNSEQVVAYLAAQAAKLPPADSTEGLSDVELQRLRSLGYIQ